MSAKCSCARSAATGTGSIITFFVKGGEQEAFLLLDGVKHMKLAVSLGGVETLIEHPSSMTALRHDQ